MLFLLAVVSLLNGCVTTFHTNPVAGKPSKENRRIVLLAPDVELSVLNVGGLAEPHAEWTQNAERLIVNHLDGKFRSIRATLVPGSRSNIETASDAKEVQLVKLHGAVGNAVLLHQYNEPTQLPTKKGKFDWGLGPEAAYLKGKYGADYALVVFVRDSYASGGRVVAFVIAAAFGVAMPLGVQVGFASLVDLETGQIVWFNRLARGAGDLRTEQGAKETVDILMTGFPQ